MLWQRLIHVDDLDLANLIDWDYDPGILWMSTK
jgi:hypothetical protein